MAVRRFGVRPPVALSRSWRAFACTAPLATYATQVYPEIPAALAVMVAVAALTGPLDRRGLAVLRRSPSSRCRGCRSSTRRSPPTLAADRGCGASGTDAATAAVDGAALAVAAAVYLLVHRAIYGGWTAYATGDYFAADR